MSDEVVVKNATTEKDLAKVTCMDCGGSGAEQVYDHYEVCLFCDGLGWEHWDNATPHDWELYEAYLLDGGEPDYDNFLYGFLEDSLIEAL